MVLICLKYIITFNGSNDFKATKILDLGIKMSQSDFWQPSDSEKCYKS